MQPAHDAARRPTANGFPGRKRPRCRAARNTSSRKISEKKPRGSRWRTGLISFTSGIAVEITCMRRHPQMRRNARPLYTLQCRLPNATKPTVLNASSGRRYGLARLAAPRGAVPVFAACERRITMPIRALSAPACAAAKPTGSAPGCSIRDSLFVPVWRNQNLVVEIEGGEPRAAVLGVEASRLAARRLATAMSRSGWCAASSCFSASSTSGRISRSTCRATRRRSNALRSPALAAAGIAGGRGAVRRSAPARRPARTRTRGRCWPSRGR